MSHGRFAIIDPAAGISGDMLLGALVAAGAPADWLTALPARLGCAGVTVEIATVDRAGIRATKVTVRLPGGASEEPHETVVHGHRHDGGHHHGHDHDHATPHQHADGGAATGPAHGDPGVGHGPHRHVGDLIGLVERAPLSEWVRARAVAAFRLLGEAEGRIHGVPAEQVALHEVGAMDALVDIVGVIEGFERLGLTRIYSRPVALGHGWVRAAHGLMPVPAPATAILLEGLEVETPPHVAGEATTPTGAVLLRVLSSGPPPGRWRALEGGSWGAGGRNPSGYANALRIVVAEGADEAGEIVALATDIDDLSPEYLEPLREALFLAGAVDVQIWATQGKKGRASFRVEALSPESAADAVGTAFFRHSTTAGLRRWRAERITLPRREMAVPAGDGTTARVKVLDGPNGARAKPEYDDVRRVSQVTGIPAHEVARDLQERALRPAGDLAEGRKIPNLES